MRELVLRVPAGALDEVLDRILPLVPAGVRERALTGGLIELSMRGAEVPDADAILRAVDCVGCELWEREVSDDWRQRRVDDYRADVIGGRLVVRPHWAPIPGARLLDVVLRDSAAFGAGTHPTTRTCLELLLEMEPAGVFADLGCGTGVLAIVAAKLGWAPVTAVDVVPAAVAATVVNAAVNGVAVQAAAADIRSSPIPRTAGFAANVPAAVHQAIAAGWRDGEAPVRGLISGIGPEQIDSVIAAYRAAGLVEAERREPHGWVVSLLTPGMHVRMTNEIQFGAGPRELDLSASKEIEPGARAMLLLAAGLFRLDVLVRGDALETFVRNLSSGPLEIEGDAGSLGAPGSTFGDVSSPSSGRADLAFRIGERADQALVRVTLATQRFPDRGVIRVSAQGIVCQA